MGPPIAGRSATVQRVSEARPYYKLVSVDGEGSKSSILRSFDLHMDPVMHRMGVCKMFTLLTARNTLDLNDHVQLSS